MTQSCEEGDLLNGNKSTVNNRKLNKIVLTSLWILRLIVSVMSQASKNRQHDSHSVALFTPQMPKRLVGYGPLFGIVMIRSVGENVSDEPRALFRRNDFLLSLYRVEIFHVG